ncbi:unnamed protein product, partial [Laminaria digitata]
STGDGFTDVLTLSGMTETANGANIVNWEAINVVDGANVTLNDIILDGVTNTASLNVCGGSATLGGASMIGSVLGCVSDDTIIVTDDAVVSVALEGAGGSDVIQVLGDASVTGLVRGGGDGQDGSAASDGSDVITIATTGSVGGVMSDAGDDTLSLLSGTVGSASGGDGDDMMTLDG